MMINIDPLFNSNAEAMVKELLRAGFDKALICGYPDGMIVKGIRMPDSGNDRVLSAAREYPDRLIPGAYINPLNDDALSQLDRFADKGFKAIKLIPADGYYPDDRSLYPFYEKAEKLGFIVILQMGLCEFSYDTAPGNRRAPNSSYGVPMKLDPICRLFPSINFVVLNMGYPLMMETFSVHHNSKNIYLHIGGEGASFNAPVSSYVALGGAGFVPLDFKRVIFGSGTAKDILTSSVLASHAVERMGGNGKDFLSAADRLFCSDGR